MLMRMQGCQVMGRGSHLVVRHPVESGWARGNALVLQPDSLRHGIGHWQTVADNELPGCRSAYFIVDDPDPDVTVWSRAAADGGMSLELQTVAVMDPAELAQSVAPGYRLVRLDTADEWTTAARLTAASDREPARLYPMLIEQMTRLRRAVGAGHGAGSWFAALTEPTGTDDAAESPTMVAALGLFTDGGGSARYRTVVTASAHRGRGVASALISFAGRTAARDWAVSRLVIAAEADSAAERLYRQLGFGSAQRQVELFSAARPTA